MGRRVRTGWEDFPDFTVGTGQGESSTYLTLGSKIRAEPLVDAETRKGSLQPTLTWTSHYLNGNGLSPSFYSLLVF